MSVELDYPVQTERRETRLSSRRVRESDRKVADVPLGRLPSKAQVGTLASSCGEATIILPSAGRFAASMLDLKACDWCRGVKCSVVSGTRLGPFAWVWSGVGVTSSPSGENLHGGLTPLHSPDPPSCFRVASSRADFQASVSSRHRPAALTISADRRLYLRRRPSPLP